MSFSVEYSANGFREECDKCGLKDDRPALTICQKSREGRNLIWVHVRCLEKSIDRAKAKGAKANDAD